ncbi:MAG TPA: hypothetical protein VGA88_14575 [Burkholderiales bacterium]
MVPARNVDHKIPHNGDPVLFWDESNWQGLCDNCHNSIKQKEEHRLRHAYRGRSKSSHP